MIDWDRVQVLLDEVGDENFDEIVELFLDEVATEISNLAVAKQNGTLGETLHFLKGSALSLGFERFSTICYTGETAAANGNPAAIDLQEILTAFDVSRKAFLDGLTEMNLGSKPTCKSSRL